MFISYLKTKYWHSPAINEIIVANINLANQIAVIVMYIMIWEIPVETVHVITRF